MIYVALLFLVILNVAGSTRRTSVRGDGGGPKTTWERSSIPKVALKTADMLQISKALQSRGQSEEWIKDAMVIEAKMFWDMATYLTDRQTKTYAKLPTETEDRRTRVKIVQPMYELRHMAEKYQTIDLDPFAMIRWRSLLKRVKMIWIPLIEWFDTFPSTLESIDAVQYFISTAPPSLYKVILEDIRTKQPDLTIIQNATIKSADPITDDKLYQDAINLQRKALKIEDILSTQHLSNMPEEKQQQQQQQSKSTRFKWKGFRRKKSKAKQSNPSEEQPLI